MQIKHGTLRTQPFRLWAMLALAALLGAAAALAAPAPALAAEPVKEGVPYRIVSVSNPSVVAQFDADAPVLGEAATIDRADGTSGQVFTFAKTESGAYYIRSYHNPSLLMTVDSLSVRGGLSAQYASASRAQTWNFVQQADGTYHIVSTANTSLMLDTTGSVTQKGAYCIMWYDNGGKTQKWTFEEVDPSQVRGAWQMPETSARVGYNLVSVCTPTVAVRAAGAAGGAGEGGEGVGAAVADGAGLEMARIATGDVLQAFAFELQADGTYLIRSCATPELVLTADAHTLRGGVSLRAFDESRAQHWIMDKKADGTWQVCSAENPAYMLDVNGAVVAAGAACIMWTNNGGTTQRWTLQQVAVVAPEVPDEPDVPEGGEGEGEGGESGEGEQPTEPEQPENPEQPGEPTEPEQPDTPGATTNPEAKLYRIVNVANPSMVVQLSGATPTTGAKAIVKARAAVATQLFSLGEMPDGSMYLRSFHNPSLVLTADGLDYRAAVSASFAAAGKAQTWSLQKLADGTYHILSVKDSTYMLDTNGAYPVDGAACIMWADNGGDTQKWRLEEVDASAIATPATKPAFDKIYRITSVSNPAVVAQFDADVPQAGTAANIAAPDNGANQAFTFDLQPDGTYLVRNCADSSLVLTADSLTVRGAVSAQAVDASKAQRWIVDVCDAAGNIHLLSAANTNYMLDTTGATTQAGASCIMWTDNGGDTQKWTLEAANPGTIEGMPLAPGTWDGKYYRLVSVSNPEVVVQLDTSVAADGSYANMGYITGGTNQVFTLEENEAGSYYIRSYALPGVVLTAKLLDTRGGVGGYALSSSRAQTWNFEPVGSTDAVRIVAASNTNFMLDTTGSTTAANSACIMWTRNSGTTQQFTLVEVDVNNLGGADPSQGGTDVPTYTYQAEYDITLLDMIQYQKSNNWYNAGTQAADLIYAVNPDNFTTADPRFFQFLRLDGGYSGVTAEELDAFIASRSSGRAGTLAGMGYAFVEAAQMYGVNEVYLLAHAIHESGWGTSTLASGYDYDGTTQVAGQYWPAGTYYNYYGIGAVDSGPLSGGRALAVKNGWDSPEAAILGAAKWIIDRYTISSGNNSYFAQNTLYEMRWHSAYSNKYKTRAYHQYATGTSWAYRIADIMATCYEYCGKTPQSAEYLIPVYSPSTIWRMADDWRSPEAYVMQWSELTIYSHEQFDELSDEELFYGRNEMFYSHGYTFDGVDGALTDADLQAFFAAKTWTPEQVGTQFTAAELANLSTIEQLERERESAYADRGYHLSDLT